MKIRNEDYKVSTIDEAGVKFLLPEKEAKNEEKTIGKSMSVFYNPRMALNRDLTICIMNTYSKKRDTQLSYCDSMAATGIRAIRLLKQTSAIQTVHINDLNPIAAETIKNNLEFNSIPSNQYKIYSQDAKILLSQFFDQNGSYLDVIDIDPFGSPNQYIPAAMQSISITGEGGLLCVTATDTPVLFGIKKEACIRKYLTRSIRTEFIKEMGTRILIYYIAKMANIFELYIQPILSISSDHYVRVFLLIKKGILGVNSNIHHFGSYIYCKSCFHRSTLPIEYKKNKLPPHICPKCGKNLITSGLVWMGNLHDQEYLEDLKSQFTDPVVQSFPSFKKMRKFVDFAKNEDRFPPYFYSLPKLADSLNFTYPAPKKIIKRLEELGYIAARTHFDPQALKTTASVGVLREILREFQS